MSLAHSLTGLSDREAITDALYRAILAFDNNDVSLLESAFSESDAIFQMDDRVFKGIDRIKSILKGVGPLGTTHTVSTIRIKLKSGDSTAKLTATAVN
jgi:hypothetical protein